MPRGPRARQRRSASMRRRFTRPSTRQVRAGWIFPELSSTLGGWPGNNGRPSLDDTDLRGGRRPEMTTFQEARAFLLHNRTDYETAVKDFRWPDPVPFNWALDWFDAELAANADSRDRPALWIVDAASGNETKLSFAELSRRSNRVANFLRAQGLQRGDHLLLLLGNVVPLWETMLAAMKLGVVVIRATTLLTADELSGRLDRRKATAVVAT